MRMAVRLRRLGPALDVYFCFNAVNLAAATVQRLQEQPRDWAIAFYEPTRLEAGSRPVWVWGRGLGWLPAGPLTLLLLLLLCWLGLVRRIYIPHRREGGRLLAAILARVPQILLLDDGLDQYRDQPRALRPEQFSPGTPIYLFSDAVAFRAPWCRHFVCRELGPFPVAATQLPPDLVAAGLLIDSPGVELLWRQPGASPRPLLLLSHPYPGKRRWHGEVDLERFPGCSAEGLIQGFPNPVAIGESFTLIIGLTRRDAAWPLWVGLPATVDDHFRSMVRVLCARRSATVLEEASGSQEIGATGNHTVVQPAMGMEAESLAARIES
ncbi:MAG: hypothetical protein NTV57_03165 [Cyanobacteria bacterium]|nr:hypothetical protein [Cyanobacteriota bacterium]